MNFTLDWNKREAALVLTFCYPFEIKPGVQTEPFEIYTKFQGYRALTAIIAQHEEYGYKLHPEEIMLFWKELQDKLFSQEFMLPHFADDDLTTIHEHISGARYDQYYVKKMRVRTFLKDTVSQQLQDAVTQNKKTVKMPNRRDKRGSPPGSAPHGALVPKPSQ